jgi:ketosteroid isomerase-like protein
MDPIHAFYDHYNRGDLDATMSVFSDDAVLVNTVLGQTFDGAVAIRGFLDDYADIVVEPRAFPLGPPQQDDGLIFTTVKLGGRLRHTGITEDILPSELVHGFRLHGGRITWYAISSSRVDVLRAAGLID